MSFYTMILVVSILGALIGIRKPWMGGIAGLVITPMLLFTRFPQNATTLIISALALFVLSSAYGLLSFALISGLKGGGHNGGLSYIIGFGAHHPGGIILSDEELKKVKKKGKKYVGVTSY